ncbi:MAG: glycerate kinase [Hyphomicrobiales bacterium]|nr:glycerate kinase [Hyphomicrobiales bacterium]
MEKPDPKTMLRALLDAALAAADPARSLARYLPDRPAGRTVVVGFGKSAAAMARALEEAWDGPLDGVVVTRYGHAVPTRRVRVLESGHPVPDQAGIDAAREILETVSGLTADDLVICLISGGGSAILTLPPDGVALAEQQALTKDMLACGATIHEINTVRKHLSRVKGGRLAAACAPARVVSLIISDVPGDDLSVIASGPTVGDRTTAADARALLGRYGIVPSAAIAAHLASPAAESPDPGDPLFARVDNRLIATPQMSLEAAAEAARGLGLTPVVLSDRIEGESREAAKVMAAIARQVAAHGQPAAAPCVLLSGGETTVTLSALGRDKGRGGPNTEFLLSLAVALDGHAGIHAIACDTDGVDGSEDNAGATVSPDTLARARAAGLKPQEFQDANDAWGFFHALGDLVVTGPTLTNVNDFRAVVIDPN